MTPQQEKKQSALLSTAHCDNQKKMNSYAFFKVHNHETGQDLVQDTFIKTWAYIVKGGKIDLMKPFLYHVLNHLIIDEYRKNKTASLDVLRDKGFEPGFDESERNSNIFDGKEALLFIKFLPAKYEEVIRMKYIKNLSIKEIALLTGQTRSTVAVQLHRGLEKLKKLYNNQ